MKKQSFVIIAAIAFVFGIGTVSASAQGQVLRADIPFEFSVGGKVLPAGEYLVKLPETAGAQVISFNKQDGDAHALTLTNQVDSKGAKTANEIVFVRSGDRYLLYQVYTQGRETGLEVLKSKRLAGTELARKTVELKMAKSE